MRIHGIPITPNGGILGSLVSIIVASWTNHAARTARSTQTLESGASKHSRYTPSEVSRRHWMLMDARYTSARYGNLITHRTCDQYKYTVS